MLKIISVNLNGIRAAASKGFFEWLNNESADFVCIQELKAQKNDMTKQLLMPDNYIGYFHYAKKKGYSGVGIYSKYYSNKIRFGFGTEEFDIEGRYVECDFNKMTLISLYCPSGSSGNERQQAKFRFMEVFWRHLKLLKTSGREIVICGDWNIAHKKIDLKNWKNNQKKSGFLYEERTWMSSVIDELGLVDVYRLLHPNTTSDAYTWWSNRGKAWINNVGWRIDYQIATSRIAKTAHAAKVYKKQRFSDHAPLTIYYNNYFIEDNKI